VKLYNSLTRKIEEFKPLSSPEVRVYTCGPTVYDYASIGNWRTYFLGDLLVRTLKYLDYKVNYVINVTDVGHLTGDNLGDADLGEDRLEKGAKREGKTAWEIAKFYIDDFLKGYKELNLTKPNKFCKATNHIQEQIELIKKIEKKGLTYKISDGIYFDTQAYLKVGRRFSPLSTLDKIKEGARVARNPEKKNPRDFSLWRFSPKGKKREMEWQSPWGIGFPGWHIECSAMSIKYLGEQFDIHLGGEDLRSTHHPNEILQSEAATGKKPFVKYWLHGAFIKVDGGRMGKSLGNAYTLQDLKKKGFTPEHLRYFFLNSHYRQPLNFTWKNLEKAKLSYQRLLEIFNSFGQENAADLSPKAKELNQKFNQALENDLQMPEALAVVWETARSDLENQEKRTLLLDWDKVLGLGFAIRKKEVSLSEKEEELLKQRVKAREEKDWPKADEIRKSLKKKGLIVKDTSQGSVVKRK